MKATATPRATPRASFEHLSIVYSVQARENAKQLRHCSSPALTSKVSHVYHANRYFMRPWGVIKVELDHFHNSADVCYVCSR